MRRTHHLPICHCDSTYNVCVLQVHPCIRSQHAYVHCHFMYHVSHYVHVTVFVFIILIVKVDMTTQAILTD